MRFLFLLLSVVLVVWLVRGLLRSMLSDERAASPPPKAISTKNLGVLVVCAHCKVHLPRDEAVFDGDVAFCDESHRAAHRQDHGSGP